MKKLNELTVKEIAKRFIPLKRLYQDIHKSEMATSLDDFIVVIGSLPPNKVEKEIVKLGKSIKKRFNSDLINRLEAIQVINPILADILGAKQRIEEIENLTPKGVEYMSIWLKSEKHT